MKPTDETILKKAVDLLPEEAKDFLMDLDRDTYLNILKNKYNLNKDDSLVVNNCVFSIFLNLKDSTEIDEDIKDATSLDTKTAEALTDELLNDFLPKKLALYKVSHPDFTRIKADNSNNDSALDKDTVLSGIENPSNSIRVSTPSAAPLGGFTAQAVAANPASAIASKLDQKFSAPVASAPKEVYQVKKPDPYHEPIE